MRTNKLRELLRAGKPTLGTRLDTASPEQAPHYVDLGGRHFSIGVDHRILFDAWRSGGEKLCKVMERL